MRRTSPEWSSGAFRSSNRPGPETPIYALNWAYPSGCVKAAPAWTTPVRPCRRCAQRTQSLGHGSRNGANSFALDRSPTRCDQSGRVSEATHGRRDGTGAVRRCGDTRKGPRATEERPAPLAPRRDSSGVIRLPYWLGASSSAARRGSIVSTSSSPVIWKSRSAIGVGA
jgi:hypothetical protein